MTLYLQQVLGYSPLATGIAFGVPGVAAVAGGVLAPRIIQRTGNRAALVGGLIVQAAGNAVLLLCGTDRSGIAIMLGALLFGFFGHIVALVAYTVTATSGLPDSEQGLATGLSTLTQQVAITIGIPILSAVAAARTGALRGVLDPARATLGGIHLALVVDVAVTLAGAALIWVGLRRRARR
jgi:predicted MFS family arabinose efflux permease